MAATTLVCTTRTGRQPLLHGGEKLYARQAHVRAVVLRRLGAQHAQLLAEVQPRVDEDRIAWLSPVDGIVRPLSALPAAVRDSVRTECDALLADMTRLADALESGATGDGQLAGKLLRMATRRPSDDHLFLVGNQPVLACWGCDPAEAGAVVAPEAEATGTPDRATPPMRRAAARNAVAPTAATPARWLSAPAIEPPRSLSDGPELQAWQTAAPQWQASAAIAA